ncbi:HlyD family type I secretion periplasmic adaptor subunit [Bosea rubneri]|uniref:Membrane fusion protein (MFP) family protein n=1 Tax=Bosea rubneri TaxID=3075434 RepID=A0ABU3S6R0_9HYPH|nr:HlyD family type I secretion periplasmic adaptor subunit [Bosea sp. ZW T0_25]MDU0340478.1 HlyD family type I secretion periplasmic adaptor subunit [Bosea sp. ZW T0_25]
MNAFNHDFASASGKAGRQAPESRTSFELRGHVLVGSTLALLLVLGFGGWAASAGLNGAVVTQGAVKIDQNLKEVQHRDGGIVQAISVRQGDHVEEGQILIRLDDVQTRAELSIIRSQLAENLGRQARLLAERDNLSSMAYSPEIAKLSDEGSRIIEGETRLFAGNKANRDSRKEQLEISIVQSGEEIRGLEARQVAKAEELRLVDLERNKYLMLHQKGFIDGVKVFNINREWARLLGERGEIEATLARAKLRIGDARLQIIAIDDTARTEAQRELRLVEAKLSELSERRIANEDRLARMEIRAPVAGIVNELTIYTVGGVITPAARLATVVPTEAKLTVEVRVAPADIDQVHVGQSARMRFSAFNRNTTPEVSGKLVHISPATSKDSASGQSFYVGEIHIEDAAIALGDRRLLPGMPVEVFISTEERTALSYLFKPLTDHAARMFRER